MLLTKPPGFYYNPKVFKWIFLFCLIALSYLYNYHQILFYYPQGIHQWRQCDCLSLTAGYFRDGNDFFHPSVNNLGEGTGKTISEFPIIYFLNAQLWKIFGQQTFNYRLIEVLIAFTGLFLLFKLIENVLKDSFWALFIVLLLFTSPVLIYYSNNFLSNVPAFSSALIGLFYFDKFYTTEKRKHLNLFAFFFLIAGLLKATATLAFVAILAIFLFEQIRFLNIKFKEQEKLFKNQRRALIIFLIPLFILCCWYLYAHNYNSRYNSNFLIGILPIWKIDSQHIWQIIERVRENFRWYYFRPIELWLLVLQLAFIIFNKKKVNRFLYFLTLLSTAGLFIFIILFFQVLDEHDYYTIDFFILMPIITVTFFLTLKKVYPGLFNSILLRVLAIIFLVHNIDFARRRMIGRYDEKGWMNEIHLKTSSFEKITPYLRSLGIDRNDKVICFPDKSINTTLYLMDQKGWTNFNISVDSVEIKAKILAGAKYLIIYSDTLLNDIQIQPFLKKKIGKFEIVNIYELQ